MNNNNMIDYNSVTIVNKTSKLYDITIGIYHFHCYYSHLQLIFQLEIHSDVNNYNKIYNLNLQF
jgi:hypothetical protein